MKKPLRKKIGKLEALLEAAVDAIISIRQDGHIESVNRSAIRLFGYDEEDFIGRNVNFLMPEPWASKHDGFLAHYQKTGEKRIIGIGREVEGLRKDGSVFPLHLSVSEFSVDGETYFSGILHDLSERKNTQDALFQAQKMEAIGQLTGGVAHDFNNLLTIITGNLELLESKLSEPFQLDLLKEAQDAADLGAGLTERLLAFARRSILEPESVDINHLIGELVDLLTRTIGRTITLETSLASTLWQARADPGQLESVLLNLAVNARDAMPGGGKLIIETSNEAIDENYAIQEAGMIPGDYIRISVSDSGEGMLEEVIKRAFEPFFTTKEKGKGTGLGLAMVYGLAKQSGGNVTIYSELGLGTTINLYLPREQQIETATLGKSEPGNKIIEPGNSQLILVVEDDPGVQRLSVQRLRSLGYNTLAANDGNQALEIIKNNRNIALVFTDLVMPGGLSGYDLSRIIREKYPDVGLLLTSGYAEDLAHGDRLGDLNLSLLRKPYKQVELAAMIANALKS